MPQTLTETVAFNLDKYLRDLKPEVEAALDASIAVIYPEKIYESMRYSLMAGGKRLRPILCLAACELLGGDRISAMPTACAMEMVHTMSLIHDDLPAMDNDDYRRGKLTNHKVYGDDIAILAGDALLAYAFEFIAGQTKGVPAERILKVIAHLGHAVAATGLVGGQVVDLECEGKPDVTAETLTFIHIHKTAALLESCVICGALLAGANDTDIKRLSTYANNIGLAYQIQDDVCDNENAYFWEDDIQRESHLQRLKEQILADLDLVLGPSESKNQSVFQLINDLFISRAIENNYQLNREKSFL